MTITEKYKRAIAEFNGKLIKPYQDQGVRWMIAREHDFTPGGILCDEMGLGKTAQTICTILADSKPTTTLILCPKSVIDQWVAEIYRFAPQFKGKVLVYGGTKRTQKPEEIAKYRIVVGSLGMAITRKYKLDTALHRVKWHRLVLDEAHDIRNNKSKSYMSFILYSRSRSVVFDGDAGIQQDEGFYEFDAMDWRSSDHGISRFSVVRGPLRPTSHQGRDWH